MYICVYTAHTHTVSSYTCLGRVVHWPLSGSHSHSPTNTTTFTDCLAIDLLISKSILIPYQHSDFSVSHPDPEDQPANGKVNLCVSLPTSHLQGAHRSCIQLQTHTTHLAPPHGTSKGNCPNKCKASSFAIGGEPDSRTPQ